MFADFSWLIIVGLIGCGIYYIHKKSKTRIADGIISSVKNNRQCLACGFTGKMKTWLGNYNGAQLIALLLLLFAIIPGLIFIAAFWNKYKCPQCGALNKSTGLKVEPYAVSVKCPYCAEIIKSDAVKCRFCGTSLVANETAENKQAGPKVHITDHQHVALSNASYDLPIYAENPACGSAQIPRGAPRFSLRTVESLERRGLLKSDGKGGYLLTPEGKEALLNNLKD